MYWEDFAVGESHEMGRHTFTLEEIREFAAKYDPQPIHVDEETAKASFFGGIIASGWHTCSVGMRFAVDSYINAGISLGSPGLDNIRWFKPVRPGDTLRMMRTIVESRPSASRPEMGLVRVLWEVFNQNEEKAMSIDGIQMFRRRAPGTAA